MRGDTERLASSAARRGSAVVGVLVAVVCIAVLFSGSGAAVPAEAQPQTNNTSIADSGDTTPPEWVGATREESTVINVTFRDNGTIDRTSISADDFDLSTGRLTNTTEIERFDHGVNNSGVYVYLELEERVNTDNVTVSFADGGGVADVEGNELTGGSATATDMDTLVPRYEGFELDRVNATTVQVRLETNERLSAIELPVRGPVDDELELSQFEESVDGTAVYTTTYTVTEEGNYTLEWNRATDRSGNFLRLSRTRGFEYDDGHPDIVLEGPTNTTAGTAVNFSAADSRADGGVESYQWRIDGGTILTGESIDVAFAVPGSYEVVVELTGANGNSSVERRQIQVAPGNDSAVTLRRQNATHATASVNGTGFRQQVRAANGPLVEGSSASLERLSVTFPAESTVNLTLGASDATPASLGPTALGVFDIAHGNVTAEQVSLRFAVNRSALDRTDARASDVTLYRNDSGWTPLETSVVSNDSSRVVYQADSPGLSEFAVGVTPDGTANGTVGDGNDTVEQSGNETFEESGNDTVDQSGNETAEGDSENTTESSETDDTETEGDESVEQSGYPDIVVTNVSVNESELAVNDTVSINVTAENRGTQAGNYSVAVVLNNTTLATHEMAVRSDGTRTRQFVHQMPEAGPLEVDGQRVANVSSGGGLVSMLPGPVGGVVSALPNPLALWPDGIAGTILGVLLGLVVVVYGVLKALAIYLGY